MKPELRNNPSDAGMCPHGNFKDSCAACQEENKQTDERLSFEEAEEESHLIRNEAIDKKAREKAKEYRKAVIDAEPDLQKKLKMESSYFIPPREKFVYSNEKFNIRRGVGEQPTKENYDKAEHELENRRKFEIAEGINLSKVKQPIKKGYNGADVGLRIIKRFIGGGKRAKKINTHA